jgi:hypothetical protein
MARSALATLILLRTLLLTACGNDEPTVQLVAFIETDPVMGTCRDRWVNVFPTGGEQVTGTADNGIELNEGTC